jgi:hypothetical protein
VAQLIDEADKYFNQSSLSKKVQVMDYQPGYKSLALPPSRP